MFWTLICIIGALVGLGVFFLMASGATRKKDNGSDSLVLDKAMVGYGRSIIIGLPLFLFGIELIWKVLHLFGK